MKKKRLFKITVTVFLFFAVFCIATVFGINGYVKHIGGKYIVTPEKACEIEDAACIIVLGCKVWNIETPSDMLKDRLTRGIELYRNGAAPKIIMSGDHGRNEYDEVNAMKKYALDAEIPSSDVFMDHAGFSTYDSMYRARDIFKADKIIIVSQKYHLYRAVYIAKKLGLTAYGVDSDYHIYPGQTSRDIREVLARCKDFLKTLFKPKPTFLGEAIPVNGNGDLTND